MFGGILFYVLVLTGIAVVAVMLNKRLLTLLLSSLFILLVATRLGVAQMYLMGAVLLALPLGSWLIAWLSARGLSVRRVAPASILEGEEAPVSVEVTSRYPLFSGVVRVGRHLPRHLRPVSRSEEVTRIPGGVRHDFSVRALRRGLYNLKGQWVSLFDPLGIFVVSRRFQEDDSVVVYPTGLEEGFRESLAGASGGWLITSTTGRRGDESGFFGTREYRVGDDRRRIHWKSSARHGNLVVVEREHGTAGSVWLALETASGAGGGVGRDRMASFETAVKLAVTAMDAAFSHGLSVGLLAAGDPRTLVSPSVGAAHRIRILESLARLGTDAPEDLSDTLEVSALDLGATVAAITCAPTQRLLDTLGELHVKGMGVVGAAVTPLPGAAPAPFPTMDSGAFAAAVERLGGDSLIVPAIPLLDAARTATV